jgi:hypothetical protein
MNWDDVQLRGSPLLIVGVRDWRRRLDGWRIDVDRDVHPDLRDVAVSALALVRGMEGIPFSPYIDPEEGEYLSIDTAALMARAKQNRSGSETDEQATLVKMVLESDYLPQMGAGQLIASTEEFYVQAICLKHAGKRVGFITRANPRQILKRSPIFLGRNDDDDRLRRITKPELVLESEVHAIVTDVEVAVLNRNMFQNLVADSKLVENYVPTQVEVIAASFRQRGVAVSSATQNALIEKASKSPRVAKRLAPFAVRVEELDIHAITNGNGFAASELDKNDFVNSAGEIHCAADRVIELLDALEGRFFDDPFSPEKRRADRFRKRK